MSQLLQATLRDPNGAIMVTDTTAPPNRWSSGLPVDADGTLSIDLAGAVSGHHMGLPVTAAGRLACSTDPVARFGSGAAPFDAAGRLSMSDASPVNFLAGVGYVSGGSIYADGLTPPPAPVWSGTPAPPNGTQGEQYSYDYAPFLNTSRVTLSLETGSLPAGMSYSGTRMVGTPATSGDFTGLSVTATNVTGADTSDVHSWMVAEASTDDALLQENGDFLLQENNDLILLEAN